MTQLIDPQALIQMYKKGYFPMAENSLKKEINFPNFFSIGLKLGNFSFLRKAPPATQAERFHPSPQPFATPQRSSK